MMTMNRLRPYQQDTLTQVYQSMRSGHRRIVVQQPPRTGKTVIMAEIAKRATDKGNHVLTVVHRQELATQTIKTFAKWGVNMSGDLCRVGMVQTLWRRVKKHGSTTNGNQPLSVRGHTHQPPAVIIIDEAHHALARSYKTIVEAYPDAIVLMFTATPYRLSGAGMAEVADDLIQGLQVHDLIDKGYLAPVDYFAPPDINTELLRRARGEFTEKSVDEALSKRIYGNAVDQYKLHADGKKAIAYCHSVASAKRLADEFNATGISALEVDGATPKEARDDAVERFRSGDVTVLTNVELFTEGLDLPNVDCVIQLRPTQSLALYLQFAMRAMNPREGKTAVILDHVGNYQRFGLPTDDREWSLDQVKPKRSGDGGATGPQIKTCPNCFGTFYIKDVHDNKCPLCQVELPKEAQEEPKIIDTDLKRVEDQRQKKLIARRLRKVHEQQQQNAIAELAGKVPTDFTTLREFQLYAKVHHFKPGWAYYRAKERKTI